MSFHTPLFAKRGLLAFTATAALIFSNIGFAADTPTSLHGATVVDAAKAKSHKTKEMAKALSGLGLTSALFVDETPDQNFTRAVGNIPLMDVLPQKGINVYDILRRDTLVLTRDAVAQLEARLK